MKWMFFLDCSSVTHGCSSSYTRERNIILLPNCRKLKSDLWTIANGQKINSYFTTYTEVCVAVFFGQQLLFTFSCSPFFVRISTPRYSRADSTMNVITHLTRISSISQWWGGPIHSQCSSGIKFTLMGLDFGSYVLGGFLTNSKSGNDTIQSKITKMGSASASADPISRISMFNNGDFKNHFNCVFNSCQII